MHDLNLGPLWTFGLPVVGLMMLGLPVMCGLCAWQTAATQPRAEALSRSWSDAAKSFAGMTLASWVLAGIGWVALHQILRFVSEMQRSG